MTGGSRGIGKAIVHRLAAEGAHVVVVDVAQVPFASFLVHGEVSHRLAAAFHCRQALVPDCFISAFLFWFV